MKGLIKCFWYIFIKIHIFIFNKFFAQFFTNKYSVSIYKHKLTSPKPHPLYNAILCIQTAQKILLLCSAHLPGRGVRLLYIVPRLASVVRRLFFPYAETPGIKKCTFSYLYYIHVHCFPYCAVWLDWQSCWQSLTLS